MNLYPVRGIVSMKRGCSAESHRVSRSLLMATLRLWSKSTNVSSCHRRERSSSRVTTSPGCSRSIASTANGWPGNFRRISLRRSSLARRSRVKSAKLNMRRWVLTAMKKGISHEVYHPWSAHRPAPPLKLSHTKDLAVDLEIDSQMTRCEL